MASPTQRTLAWLRERGFEAGVVERHNAFSGKKNDLFGFVDIVAISADDTIGVQATSGSNVQARIKKIVELPAAKSWLAGGKRRIWVVGWKKYRKRIDGKQWRPIVRELLQEDIAA